MTDQTVIYQAAMLQFRPVVASEERLNIGVLLYAPDTGEFAVEISDHYGRLTHLFPELDGVAYRRMVRHMSSLIRNRISPKRPGPAGASLLPPEQLPTLAEVMKSVGNADDGNFSWSSVRYGYSQALSLRAKELFDEFVLRYERHQGRKRVDDDAVWDRLRSSPVFSSIENKITSFTLRAPKYDLTHTFRAAWMNGKRQLAEPISLDYSDPRDMVGEANRWRGLLDVLSENNEAFELTAIITSRPAEGGKEYDQAEQILAGTPTVRKVITDAAADELVRLVASDLAGH